VGARRQVSQLDEVAIALTDHKKRFAEFFDIHAMACDEKDCEENALDKVFASLYKVNHTEHGMGSQPVGGEQMTAARSLSASLEDYLEAIFHIVSAKQASRAKDISDRMGVNKSSVTGALRSLSERGLVNYAPYDIITLTDEGRRIAERVVHRHEVLKGFFVEVLGVDEDDAEQTACRMEHRVSSTILRRLACLDEFIGTGPAGDRQQWLRQFRGFCIRRERILADQQTRGDGESPSPGHERT
jgi:Mn-dependent DtxR family transcriptional regulator